MRRALVSILVALSAPLTASAQDASTLWTDARVVARATEHAPLVREARAELDRATAGRVSGERPPIGNPLVGVMLLPGVPDFGAWTTAVSVGIPIEVSGLRGVWSREAERGVQAARARLLDATLRATCGARRARVELSIAEALLNVQREHLVTTQETERRVRARSEAGASTGLDVALAERETAMAEAELAAAEVQVVDARAALRSALDLRPTDPVEVDAPGRPEGVEAATLEAVTARAAGRRADVVAHEHDAERLSLAEARVGRGAIAPLMVGFEAQQVAVGPQDLGVSVGASLRWELPIVQRAQGDRAMLRADASAARTVASILRAQVARDVGHYAESLARSLAELDAIEHRAIPAAERVSRATEAAFSTGALDTFRVLVARGELLHLRARALEALRNAWSARFDYERASSVGATE
jgi:outer membrane protein TolC